MNEKRRKTALILIIIFLWVTLFFGYSIQLREPWFGVYQSGEHQWLTGSTIKFTKNWIAEDPASIKFALLENPPSIEFPTLESRGIYASYPPGTVIPIFILVKLFDNVSFPEVIMTYNLVNHYFIGLIISIVMFRYLLSLDLEPLPSLLFAFIPPVILFLLPGPLYWFQNIYWADQAVILPFVIFISLEILLDIIARSNLTSNPDPIVKYKSQILVVQGMVGFIGIFTDWLFLFVYGVIFVKRIILHEFERENHVSFLKMGYFFLPAIIGLGFFVVQIFSLGQIKDFFQTVEYRTSLDTAGRSVITNFQDQMINHFNHSFGNLGWIFILISFLAFLVLIIVILLSKRSNNNINVRIISILSFIGIVIFPCIAHLLVGSNHSYIHSFSVLKFSFALSIVPFILLPVSLLILFESVLKKKPHNNHNKLLHTVKIIIPLILLILVVFYVNASPQLTLFGTIDDYSAEHFINENTGYNDIVFSLNDRINFNPPQKITYSMKRVYFIEDLDDIHHYQKIWNIDNEPFIINIFLKKYNLNELLNQTLFDNADKKFISENYVLYKFDKENQFFQSINYCKYYGNWYSPECCDSNGLWKRWMNKEAELVIELFDSNEAVISFELLSFYSPRHVQITINENLVIEEIVETEYSLYKIPVDGNYSIVRFYAIGDIMRPIDLPELNNEDDRYLSIAIKNVTVHPF